MKHNSSSIAAAMLRNGKYINSAAFADSLALPLDHRYRDSRGCGSQFLEDVSRALKGGAVSAIPTRLKPTGNGKTVLVIYIDANDTAALAEHLRAKQASVRLNEQAALPLAPSPADLDAIADRLAKTIEMRVLERLTAPNAKQEATPSNGTKQVQG